MIIVIEGPDCSGKTTLAHHLAKEFCLAYHHESVPPEDMSALTHYYRVLEALPRNCVIDRFALGECVYGPILRGRNGLNEHIPNENGWDLVLHWFLVRHVFQIICLPSLKECLKHYDSSRELLSLEQYKESYIAWAKLAVNAWVYDWTKIYATNHLSNHLDAWKKYYG